MGTPAEIPSSVLVKVKVVGLTGVIGAYLTGLTIYVNGIVCDAVALSCVLAFSRIGFGVAEAVTVGRE